MKTLAGAGPATATTFPSRTETVFPEMVFTLLPLSVTLSVKFTVPPLTTVRPDPALSPLAEPVPVDGPWFRVQLAGSGTLRLRLVVRRFAYRPSYAFPWAHQGPAPLPLIEPRFG